MVQRRVSFACLAVAAMALAACRPKPNQGSAALESDPNFPVSCAEAGGHKKTWTDLHKFYVECKQKAAAASPAAPAEAQASASAPTPAPGADASQLALTGNLDYVYAGEEGLSLVDKACPAAAELDEKVSSAKKSLDGWATYQRKVCAASTQAAGGDKVKVDFGDYDYYNNNCHDAANAGVCSGPPKRTGVVRCIGGEGAYYSGHTLNYITGPCMVASATCQTICLFEPQFGQDSNQCCWEQGMGAVDLKSGKGKLCADQKCLGANNGKQDVLPPGQLLPKDTPTDCRDTMRKGLQANAQPSAAQRETCAKCCDTVGNRWVTYINKASSPDREKYEASRVKYVGDCKAACAE